jgi:SAM-dependent methyltransferase
MNKNIIKDQFDSQWKSQELERNIKDCPNTEIFPIIDKYVKKNLKILESGCGAGKWVFYYHRKGCDISGIDWSQEVVNAAKSYDPSVKILQGDARSTGFHDNEFDVILSLGTVEHDINGPAKALKEIHRLLKKNGIAIVTVPALTKARKMIYGIKKPLKVIHSKIKSSRKDIAPLDQLIEKGIKDAYMMTMRDSTGYNFFEYRFPLEVFSQYVEDANLEIVTINPAFKDDGFYHDLKPLVGKWDYANGKPNLNLVGKILKKLLPDVFSHMIVCVATKK